MLWRCHFNMLPDIFKYAKVFINEKENVFTINNISMKLTETQWNSEVNQSIESTEKLQTYKCVNNMLNYTKKIHENICEESYLNRDFIVILKLHLLRNLK